MREATHLHGTVFERRINAVLETLSGGALPEWPDVAAASIVLGLEAGDQLPSWSQPMFWWVLSGTIRNYVVVDGRESTLSYTSAVDMLVTALPEELYVMFDFPIVPHLGLTRNLELAEELPPLRGQAYEDTVIVGCPAVLLVDKAKRNQRWMSLLMAGVLLHLGAHIHREVQLLTLSPEEQYKAFVARNPQLARKLSQREIARHLNLTPVGLNRIVARVRARSTPDEPEPIDD